MAETRRDSLACLKLSLGSSIYIVVWKLVRYDVLELNTAYQGCLAWAPRIKYSIILAQEIGYSVLDLLYTTYQTYSVRRIELLRYSVLGSLGMAYWLFGYGVLSYSGTVYCISWVRHIDLLGYGVLAESVLFLIFDQSIIYDVYTDVDTAYSSKSGNSLLIRQSLGYVV
ncbi:hypothetical protein Tco_0247286 [Tanacetum coccineum]